MKVDDAQICRPVCCEVGVPAELLTNALLLTNPDIYAHEPVKVNRNTLCCILEAVMTSASSLKHNLELMRLNACKTIAIHDELLRELKLQSGQATGFAITACCI